MNYDMKLCGGRIRQLRLDRKYTQDELAAAMNINRSFLSRIESGEKGCSVDLFVHFSDFFQVSLDFLILGRESYTVQKIECKEHLKADISNLLDQLILLQKQL